MKSLNLFFAFMLTLGILGSYAQQSLQVTAIFPKNFCQTYNSTREAAFKVEFQLAGMNDQDVQNFNTKAIKTDGIINFKIDAPAGGLRTAKVEMAPQSDFDYIRTFLQENGVRFINEEDVIMSIYDWKPYTSDQCEKLTQLNQQIINIETKVSYIQKDVTQRNIAEGNGWFVESANFLEKAKEAKKNYLESIK